MTYLLSDTERLVRSIYGAVEFDLLACFRYVELTPRNIYTNSLEFYMLHQTVCQQIETVLRFLLEVYAERPEGDLAIDDYIPVRDELGLWGSEARMEMFLVRPFEYWEKSRPPGWWSCHTDMKHEIAKHFEKANLGVVIQSMGALNILLNHREARFVQPLGTRIFDPFWPRLSEPGLGEKWTECSGARCGNLTKDEIGYESESGDKRRAFLCPDCRTAVKPLVEKKDWKSLKNAFKRYPKETELRPVLISRASSDIESGGAGSP